MNRLILIGLATICGAFAEARDVWAHAALGMGLQHDTACTITIRNIQSTPQTVTVTGVIRYFGSAVTDDLTSLCGLGCTPAPMVTNKVTLSAMGVVVFSAGRGGVNIDSQLCEIHINVAESIGAVMATGTLNMIDSDNNRYKTRSVDIPIAGGKPF